MADSGQRIADSGQDSGWWIRTRWVICWLIALGAGGFTVGMSWMCFNDAERADGNWGHVSIDFGGQWVMGRMIVEGHGRQLYNRNYLRGVVEGNYPVGVESAKAEHSDAYNLLSWLSGTDDPGTVASFLTPLAARNPLDELTLLAAGRHVWTPERLQGVLHPRGGALYPPVHALLFAPLAALRPQIAYRVLQALFVILVFFDGWVIQRLTDGRVWWPVATVFIMMFPDFGGAINLGQNSVISLTVLLAGWWQLTRGRPGLAGLCWGLLAFKPVWAASFLLVPLLTRRWRMAASMVVTGIVQIALTLPVVGWESWLDWLHVGRAAAEDYTIQENWIVLSRDLLGIPRRWLLSFDKALAVPEPEKQALATVLGWSLWTAVLLITLLIVGRRWRRMKAESGPVAAFVLLGAFFTCYHFMYYDFLLAGLPVLLLFTEPRRYFQAVFWRPANAPPPTPEVRRYYQPTWDNLTPPPMPLLPEGRRARWVLAPLPPLLLFLILVLPRLSHLYDLPQALPPSETVCLLLLWAWCGYRVLRDGGETTAACGLVSPVVFAVAVGAAQLPELGTDVGRAHEGLADQHGADAGRL
jgi:arabinofuranan 3-O-arabinosyltransferase